MHCMYVTLKRLMKRKTLSSENDVTQTDKNEGSKYMPARSAVDIAKRRKWLRLKMTLQIKDVRSRGNLLNIIPFQTSHNCYPLFLRYSISSCTSCV